MYQNKVGFLEHGVHHCYNSIISGGLRELYHKVNNESILSGIWYWDRVELSNLARDTVYVLPGSLILSGQLLYIV